MGKLTGPLFSVIGVGMLWLAYLSATERLKRNGTVGMRTKATMASDAAWYAAHRASAWSVAVAGLIFLGVGIWLLATQPDEPGARTAVLGSAIAILVVIVIGGIQADRVAKGVPGLSAEVMPLGSGTTGSVEAACCNGVTPLARLRLRH